MTDPPPQSKALSPTDVNKAYRWLFLVLVSVVIASVYIYFRYLI